MGNLYGLFVAEKDAVTNLVESKRVIYFGEVLGKHSEIAGPLEARDVNMVSDDTDLVAKVKELNMEVGFNPVRQAADYDENGN
ncbi:MAG: hypothetical protein KKH60_05825 [Proteobacteria bacterium]|nr:hypothetical protein [Pseudomonadota bacterium]